MPIKSSIRNAFIDFSQMTVSIVGIQSDVLRDGAPIIGYGFNSNGRYSQSGILRDRFIPRLLNAEPDALLSDGGGNFDPRKSLGHHDGEREAGRAWRTLGGGRCSRNGALGSGRED